MCPSNGLQILFFLIFFSLSFSLAACLSFLIMSSFYQPVCSAWTGWINSEITGDSSALHLVTTGCQKKALGASLGFFLGAATIFCFLTLKFTGPKHSNSQGPITQLILFNKVKMGVWFQRKWIIFSWHHKTACQCFTFSTSWLVGDKFSLAILYIKIWNSCLKISWICFVLYSIIDLYLTISKFWLLCAMKPWRNMMLFLFADPRNLF